MGTIGKQRWVRVKDVTNSFPTCLSPTQTLEDAARVFTNEGIDGAPVVDGGRLVGVLSKSDLVERGPFIPHSPRAKVGDAMTRDVVTARLSDSAMSVVHAMVTQRIHRIVVVDGDDHPLGVVSTMDILDAIARGDPLQSGDPAFEERTERHQAPAAAVLFAYMRS